jgi:hypothetical protein
MPVAGAGLESRHFDPSAPPHKIRHQLTLSLSERPVVRIDVWDDPQGLEVTVWTEQHLRHLLDGAAAARPQLMTPRRLEGLLLEHPRSPQALARTTALLATGGRVFRVTCLDRDDAAAQALFERLVDELDPEARP